MPMARSAKSPKPAKASKPRKSPKSAKPGTSRKSANRPKPEARRTKPASRAAASRRPARSSKPQRKPKAPTRKAAKPKAARAKALSGPRKAAPRPASGKSGGPAGKRLRIVLFGAGGMVGTRIAKEAVARGHRIVPVQRNAGGLDLDGKHLLTVQGDATDPRSVAALAKGADAVVSAVSPRNPPGADTLPRAAKALLEGTRQAGVRRLVVVGGAGSLSVDPRTMLLDSPGFPDAYRPEALEHLEALHVYRREGQGVDWTFISPAAAVFPGKRTGKYQTGEDHVLLDATGKSQISAEDYAVALVDELERGANKGRRMAVAWP
jgi:putative NADH-flavin reductase